MAITFYILLLFAQVKDRHFPTQESFKSIHFGTFDQNEKLVWRTLDSTNTPFDSQSDFSIYVHRIIDKPTDLHKFWDFYLDSTHVKFRQIGDSLLRIFPKKPYRMRYVSENRSLDKQAHLLRIGRSKLPLSLHNFGFALDVGLYRGKRYLKRGNQYLKMGEKAKNLGLYWGGDFVGFPDPGHIQYFQNSASFIQQFPKVGFEFLKYQSMFETNYFEAQLKGKEANYQDTKKLLEVLNNLFPEIRSISDYSIELPSNSVLRNWMSKESINPQFVIIFHPKEKWVYIQKGLQGYCWEVK